MMSSNVTHGNSNQRCAGDHEEREAEFNEPCNVHELLEGESERQILVCGQQRQCPVGIANFSMAPHIMVTATPV